MSCGRLTEQIEALQAELHNVKAVEFPARVDKVCEDWRKRAEKAEAQIEALQREAERRYDVFIATSNKLREAQDQIEALRQLVRETMADHANADSGFYNTCDDSPCNWCERANRVLGGPK